MALSRLDTGRKIPETSRGEIPLLLVTGRKREREVHVSRFLGGG